MLETSILLESFTTEAHWSYLHLFKHTKIKKKHYFVEFGKLKILVDKIF